MHVRSTLSIWSSIWQHLPADRTHCSPPNGPTSELLNKTVHNEKCTIPRNPLSGESYSIRRFSQGREYFSRLPGFISHRGSTSSPMLFSKRPRTDEFEAAAMPHMNDIYRTAARLLANGSGGDDAMPDVFPQGGKG